MSFVVTADDPVRTNEEHLRTEFGWKEVQSGLGRILLGYVILVGGTLLCAGLMAIAVFHMIKHPTTTRNPNLASLWMFHIGFGLLGLVCPISYGIILLGKVRCALSAPERHGTKWMMFACLTCILMGPALNVASCVTGMNEAPEIRRGPDGFRRIKFSKVGGGMQLAGGILGLSSMVFFLLFLRGIGRCFLDHGRVLLVNAYLFFLALLVAGGAFLILGSPRMLVKPPVLLGLGGALVLSFLWYLYLIGTFRTCISQGLSQIRSPLEIE